MIQIANAERRKSKMLTFIIGIVALGIVGFFAGKKDNEAFGGTMAGSLIGMVASGILFIMFSFTCPSESSIFSESELVCMKDSSGINGSFFLGSGYFEDKMRYVGYVKGSDGGLKMKQWSSSEVTVYENDNEKPRVITIKRSPKGNWKYFTVIPGARRTSYKVFVPTGSIIRQIELNAE